MLGGWVVDMQLVNSTTCLLHLTGPAAAPRSPDLLLRVLQLVARTCLLLHEEELLLLLLLLRVGAGGRWRCWQPAIARGAQGVAVGAAAGRAGASRW